MSLEAAERLRRRAYLAEDITRIIGDEASAIACGHPSHLSLETCMRAMRVLSRIDEFEPTVPGTLKGLDLIRAAEEWVVQHG